MKESTKKIFRLHGWRLDRAVHNYFYFLFYDLYVKAALYLTRAVVALFSRFEATKHVPKFIFERYHAKVLSRGDVTKILDLEESVELGPDTTKRIIPFRYANKIVLREPTHLAVMDCPCKLEMDDPCRPVASCIAVGRPVVDFWLEHCGKYHARRISKEEALAIIDEYRRNGHINQAFFKVATGGSMGVICNCCPRCCVSMRATALVGRIKGAEGISQYAPSGYTVRHDTAKCDLCGTCVQRCHFGAVEIVGGERRYHPEKCYGCELCVEGCPQGALSLVLEEGGLLPLDMDRVEVWLRADSHGDP
ncbi:MAG: 4Fe-4S binding protein [Actinobacteria bacterium]|nr:4Fe-4S binding protein [Actinomycetota bacterium]